MDIVIASYNILDSALAIKWGTEEGYTELEAGNRESNWHNGRKDLVLANLRLAGFGIACLQEVSEESLADIARQYPVAHSAIHKGSDVSREHGVAIIHTHDAATLIEGSQRTYDSPGGWRSAVACDFNLKGAALRVRALSVHVKGFDGPDSDRPAHERRSPKEGYEELEHYLAAMGRESEPADLIVVAGDLNEYPGEVEDKHSRLRLLKGEGFQPDPNTDSTVRTPDKKIDWIFYRAERELESHCVDLSAQDLSASDHRLIAVRLLTS